MTTEFRAPRKLLSFPPTAERNVLSFPPMLSFGADEVFNTPPFTLDRDCSSPKSRGESCASPIRLFKELAMASALRRLCELAILPGLCRLWLRVLLRGTSWPSKLHFASAGEEMVALPRFTGFARDERLISGIVFPFLRTSPIFSRFVDCSHRLYLFTDLLRTLVDGHHVKIFFAGSHSTVDERACLLYTSDAADDM
eukprot:325516-Rhodomonas_salina.1